MFKPYDKVWIMRNNRPVAVIVFAVVQSMDYAKTGTEVHYHVVDSTIGAGWGNNEGARVSPEDVFATREDLLASLQN